MRMLSGKKYYRINLGNAKYWWSNNGINPANNHRKIIFTASLAFVDVL